MNQDVTPRWNPDTGGGGEAGKPDLGGIGATAGEPPGREVEGEEEGQRLPEMTAGSTGREAAF